MNDDSNADLEVKINRLLDDELSQADRAELERQLLRDPAAHAMLRTCTALDEQCRDALDAALGRPATAAVRQAGRRRALWAASAAAAAVLLVAVLWSAFPARPPGPDRDVATIPENPAPTSARTVELMLDRFDPAPPAGMSARPVRNVDRFPVGVFDAEAGQLRIFHVDREHNRIQPVWDDL